MSTGAVENPAMTEGEKIAHLVDLAGYIATKQSIVGDDPRFNTIMDAAIKQVQDANVLPDLLRIMHQQNQQRPNPIDINRAQRDAARNQWEADMRQTTLDGLTASKNLQDIENAASQLLLKQLLERLKS